MFLAVATRGMKRIADRQGYLGVHPALNVMRRNSSIDLAAATALSRPKLLKHRIGPVEKPLVALRIGSRVLHRRLVTPGPASLITLAISSNREEKFEKIRVTTCDQEF